VEHRGNADDNHDELAGDAVCQPLDVRLRRLPRKWGGFIITQMKRASEGAAESA